MSQVYLDDQLGRWAVAATARNPQQQLRAATQTRRDGARRAADVPAHAPHAPHATHGLGELDAPQVDLRAPLADRVEHHVCSARFVNSACS